MNPPLPSGLYSIAKVAILTFCGAFFGALTMTGLPTTVEQAKLLLLPPLGVAVAAELYYLRTTIAKLLAAALTAQAQAAPVLLAPPADPVTLPALPKTDPVTAAAAKLSTMALLCLLAVLPGCSWFGANKGTVVADVGGLSACVIGELLTVGTSDPNAIVSACSGVALTDVEQIATSLLESLVAPPDGGVATASSITIARLQAVQLRAHMLQKDGGQ